MYSSTSYINLEKRMQTELSPARFEHSKQTVCTMAELFTRFPDAGTQEDARYIGIFHDAARQWSDQALCSYAQEKKLHVEKEEMAFPALLHAPVAASLLEAYVPGASAHWKTAIRWHTLGNKDMGKRGFALYVADYLEPGRTHISDEERFSILSQESLEAMVLAIIDRKERYLRKKGRAIASCTAALRDCLLGGGHL